MDAPRAAMLESCRFETHRFVAFSRLPLVIIYNPRLVSSPPAGFADLLESRLRGRIAFANPGVSGSSFTVLATLIQALGDEDALGRFADNVATSSPVRARWFPPWRRAKCAWKRDAIRTTKKP